VHLRHSFVMPPCGPAAGAPRGGRPPGRLSPLL